MRSIILDHVAWLKQGCWQAALAVALLLLAAATARADAIDGQWCDGSKHFKIDGPNIVTPGGNVITGNYGRHDFSYVVPDGEVGAGENVDMQLLDEEHVRVSFGTSAPKIWRRCKVTSWLIAPWVDTAQAAPTRGTQIIARATFCL